MWAYQGSLYILCFLLPESHQQTSWFMFDSLLILSRVYYTLTLVNHFYANLNTATTRFRFATFGIKWLTRVGKTRGKLRWCSWYVNVKWYQSKNDIRVWQGENDLLHQEMVGKTRHSDRDGSRGMRSSILGTSRM